MSQSDQDKHVVGAFADEGTAAQAARDLQRVGVPADEISIADAGDEAVAMKVETRDETDRGLWAPGAAGTRSQTIGWIVGLAVAGAVGAALGAMAGLLISVWASGSTLGWVLIVGVVGAFAGGTIGFTVGGSVGPHVAGEVGPDDRDVPTTTEANVTVAVHTDDAARAAKARDVFEAEGAQLSETVEDHEAHGGGA